MSIQVSSAGIHDSPGDGNIYGRKDSAWVNISQPASLQVRRGTDSERMQVVPLEGEPIYVTDLKRMYVGDGVTAGGVPVGDSQPYSAIGVVKNGDWSYEPPLLLSQPVPLAIGSTIYNYPGKWLSGFFYNENTAASRVASPPTQVSFGDLTGISGGLTYYSKDVQSLSLPALRVVGGSVTLNDNTALSAFSAPVLFYVGGTLNLSGTLPLTNLSLPSLSFADGISLGSHDALLSVDLPSLSDVSGTASILFSNDSAINATLSLPLLRRVGVSLSISGLRSVSLPSLALCGSVSLTGSLIQSVTLPVNGTLKSIGNITASGLSLTQASVDNILQAVASLDGTSQTRSWGSGRSLNVSGGTSAAPSNLGSTTRAGSSFVCAGTTCTVSWPGHGYTTGDVLQVSGVGTATNANRYAVITVQNSGQFTYTISSQTATGSGTATVVRAGNSAKSIVTRGGSLTTN